MTTTRTGSRGVIGTLVISIVAEDPFLLRELRIGSDSVKTNTIGAGLMEIGGFSIEVLERVGEIQKPNIHTNWFAVNEFRCMFIVFTASLGEN
jgi:hypothetical protein